MSTADKTRGTKGLLSRMKQFEFRQSSLQQNSVPVLPAMSIAISSSYIMEQELRAHYWLRPKLIEHISYIETVICKMNLPNE